MARPTRTLVHSAMILLAASALAGELYAQGAPTTTPTASVAPTAPPTATVPQLPPAPPAPGTAAPPPATAPPYPPAPPPRYGTYPPSAYPPGYTPPVYPAQPQPQPQPYPPQPQVPPPQQGAGPYPYGYGYGYNPWAHMPATIPVVEGKQPPQGYREETSTRRSFVITGAVAFGVSYGGALLAASTFGPDSNDYDSSNNKRSESEALPLFIPCLGPFIGLATLDPSPVGTAWLVLDGLTQTAGLSLLIVGLLSPNKKWIRMDLATASVRVTPIMTGSQSGLGVLGRF